jgi:type I restriction enzyme S subunit
LTKAALNRIPVPLPPLAEQREIVARVSALFARADAIDARLTAARTAADRLTQAVLAKAFRGELVPTEAELARRENRTYEPASELLARVRTATEQPAAPKPARKRKPKPNAT